MGNDLEHTIVFSYQHRINYGRLRFFNIFLYLGMHAQTELVARTMQDVRCRGGRCKDSVLMSQLFGGLSMHGEVINFPTIVKLFYDHWIK